MPSPEKMWHFRKSRMTGSGIEVISGRFVIENSQLMIVVKNIRRFNCLFSGMCLLETFVKFHKTYMDEENSK
jgi:hypothetical protein